MKRYILTVTGILFLIPMLLTAQNEIDALRYSQNFPVGTARSLGLGGAIGAVGGDFTSLSINPAGIGLYRSSELTFTPSLQWDNTSANFLGNTYTDERYALGLGNLGFVFNNDLNRESGWVSTSFGFGYNKLNNYNQEIFMGGIQNNSSYLDNFVYYAGTLDSDALDPYYEALAYDTYMIDWDDANNEYFNDFADAGYGQVQERSISSKGSLGEFLFSFGANYNNRLYLGATVGLNRVRFEQTVTHYEGDPGDIIEFTDEFTFEEYLFTRGIGYNLKLGAIARPADFLRIGAAFHLPTFYYLKDEFENSMEAWIDPEEDFSNPQVATSGTGDYRYRLRSPAKAVGSAAIIFGKVGMLSMDYEFINYKNSDLSASDYDFKDENKNIETIYRPTHNFRFGGEVRFGPAYVRGGYALYASPYATSEPNIDADRNVFSGGIGVRNRFFYVDATYSYAKSESRYYPYVPGIVDGALLTSKQNSVLVSVGVRF